MCDDEYCLIGDNRQGSVDSRNYGAVSKENIKGIVVFRLFPLRKNGQGVAGKEQYEKGFLLCSCR